MTAAPMGTVAGPTLSIQIGQVGVAIESEQPAAAADLRELYSGFPVCSGEPLVRLAARREGRSLLGRPRYAIYGDEQRVFARLSTNEVLPHLEWAMNWRVVARANAYIQLHAAALVREERALLLVGRSGTGKSTLAAGLLSRGWGYYGDEIALVDPSTLHVHAYPKAICIKAGSFEVIRRLGLALWRRRHYARAVKGPVGYVRPPASDPATLYSRPVHLIVFPQYCGEQGTCVSAMPRGEAAFELARCQVNRGTFGGSAAQRLCTLARSAGCHRLRFGPIEDALDAIERLSRTASPEDQRGTSPALSGGLLPAGCGSTGAVVAARF